MIEIQEISAGTLAFPAYVKHLMPTMEEIPEQFKHFLSPKTTKWNNLFNDWFFLGLTELKLTPKQGIDKNKALRHIRAIMGSFEPQHEHKEAAVAYLLSEWFEDAVWEQAKREEK